MKIVEKNASNLTPFYLAMRKLKPEDFPTAKLSDEEVAKRFKGNISINVKDEGDGKKTAQIKISGEGEKDFDRAMAELRKAEDMSAKSQRFQLGWLALCEKFDELFPLLPKVIKSKQLSREELRDFPIFEEVRKDKRCNKFLPKELEKVKQIEK